MKVLSFIAILAGCANATTGDDVQLASVKQFIGAFKDPAVTNAQIIERYTVPAQYFRSDSVRRLADQWIEEVRNRLILTPEIEVLPYRGHEAELAVSGGQPVGSRCPGAPKKTPLEFTLALPGGKQLPVDEDHVYFVRARGGEAFLFILLDNDGKVLAFAGMQIGFFLSLWQW